MEDGRLVDLYAIQQLKARYFRYIDTKQWDLFRGLFTEDAAFYFFDDSDFHAESTGSPPQATREFSGGDKFVRRVSKILETAVTVHHGHMPEIEFTGPDRRRGSGRCMTGSMTSRRVTPPRVRVTITRSI